MNSGHYVLFANKNPDFCDPDRIPRFTDLTDLTDGTDKGAKTEGMSGK